MEDLCRILLSGLDHQIALAHDPDYTYPSHEYVPLDGESVKRITYKRPAPWWFEEGDTLFLRLNFGERTMILPGKNPAIRVAAPSNLLPTPEAPHPLAHPRPPDAGDEK